MLPQPVPMSATWRVERERELFRIASASSTMNSVSGRGMRTAGVTAKVEAPELPDADDVRGRLAAMRRAIHCENVGSSAAGAGPRLVR